jgi:predicted transcriptional regulator
MGNSTSHGKTLYLDVSTANEEAVAVLKALASEWRIRVLQLLGTEARSVSQLAEMLGIPQSNAAMHVKALEEAGLIHTEMQPASRGVQKSCSRRFDQVVITLPPLEPHLGTYVEVAMPIGAYVNFDVTPTCGLASETAIIGVIDDPASFLEPERLGAQLLWFRQGFVEYRFPARLPAGARPTALQLRMEICSEAPTHNLDWPSDITVWINGVEIGTWTAPGDLGGTRGALTPAWWLDIDSQFGYRKTWEVNAVGSFVDGVQISDVTLRQLQITPQGITVRIGVKPDARNKRGLNLFGKKFGNYPEDLVLRIVYDLPPADATRES